VVPAYIAACLVWGSTWMMIKIGLRGAPPITSVAVRMTIASLIVAALIRVMRVPLPRDRRFVGLGVFLGIFQITIPYVLVYIGEESIPSGLAAVLYATLPLMVALLARAWLKNPLTPRKLTGIATGFLGVARIFSDNLRLGREQATGTLLVMGSVASSAVATVATKRWGHGHHPIASLLLPFGTTALATAVLALGFESPLVLHYDAATWATILYLAAMGSVVAFACFFYVMKRLDVTVVTYQTFIIPVVAVILGGVFLGEIISGRVALGALLILAGISLATFARRPRERKT